MDLPSSAGFELKSHHLPPHSTDLSCVAMSSYTTSYASGSTGVRNLTSVQLQAALRARGVRMPSQVQTHTWYLQRAQEIRLTEVPNSELQRGGPPSAATVTSPGRRETSGSYGSRSYSSSAPVRLEIGVVDVQLSSEAMRGATRPRNVSVRVEPPAGVEKGTPPAQLLTRTVAVGAGSSPVLRFDSSHVITLEKDGSAWSALARSLDGPKQTSDMYLVALDAASGQPIGEAYLRLQSLVDDPNPPTSLTLDLLDVASHTRNQGSVTVRIDGLMDALYAVRDGSRPASRDRGRDDSPRGRGGYDRGRGGDAEIEFGVQQVKLLGTLTRYPMLPQSLSVRVDALCIFDSADPILETPSLPPATPASMSATRFDWTHIVQLNRGSPEWERLGYALGGDSPASDVQFTVRDYARNKTLGLATVNLRKLLDDGAEKVAQNVRVVDASGLGVAEIMLTVRALEALREVDRGDSSSRTASRTSYGRPGSASSERSPSRGSSRAETPRDDAEIEIKINELRLQMGARSAPRNVAVRVEALGMEDGQRLETRGMPPAGGNTPIRYNWSHTLSLSRGSASWEALSRAVSDATASQGPMRFFFVVIDASSGTEMGEANYDLAPLLKEYAREAASQQQLQVKDKSGGVMGQLSIRVKALDALKLVRDASQPPPPAVPSGPAKRVDQLSLAELQAVLAHRKIRLPPKEQGRHFYMDLMNKHRIRSVEADELNAAMGQPTEVRVELAVQEAQLTDRAVRYSQPRTVAVRVEALGMEDGQRLETRAMPPAGGNTPMRYNWSQTLTLSRGSAGWDALTRGVGDGESSGRFAIGFVAIDGSSGATLGEASFDLTPLLRNAAERPTQQLQLFDSRQLAVGHVIATVKAVEAIEAVRKAPEYAPASSRPRIVKVKVPSLHLPGEPVQVEADGQTFDVQVPRGLRPGQSFDAELPGLAPEPPPPSRGSRPTSAASRDGGRYGEKDSARDNYGGRDQQQQPDSASGRGRGRWGADAPPAVETGGRDGGRESARGGSAQGGTSQDRRKAYDAQRKADSQQRPQPSSGKRSPGRAADRDDRGFSSTMPADDRGGAGVGRRWSDASSQPDGDAGRGSGPRWPTSQQSGAPPMPPVEETGRRLPSSQSGGAAALSVTMPAGISYPAGSAPTEVEHALIVAFERLGQAQSQISSHSTQRSKLEKELAREREQSATLTKELRQLKAEREAQSQRLAELGASMGGGGGATGMLTSGSAGDRQAALNYTETLKKRLGAFQTAKTDEMRSLNKKLQEARDATAREVKERTAAERQTADALRRLSETQAALDMERRHAQAVGTERERLQTSLAEAQLQLQEVTIVLDSEQQLRYQLEEAHGVQPPHGVSRPPRQPAFGALTHEHGMGASMGASRGGAGGRCHLAASMPVRSSLTAKSSRAGGSRGGSRPASRPTSPGGSKVASPLGRERSTSRERDGDKDREGERAEAPGASKPRRWVEGGAKREAAAPSASAERDGGRAAVSSKVTSAFAHFDRDFSGYLDTRELKSALRYYGLDVDGHETKRFLSAYDDTPDGKLDIAEFATLIKDLEAPLFQATHGLANARGGRAAAPSASGVPESIPEHSAPERRPSADRGVPTSAAKRPYGGHSYAQASRVAPPPPTPCSAAAASTASSQRAVAYPPASPMRASGAAAYVAERACGSASALAARGVPSGGTETAMAMRMRAMDSDLTRALDSGVEKGRHAPPLSQAYQTAVARRDASEGLLGSSARSGAAARGVSASTDGLRLSGGLGSSM